MKIEVKEYYPSRWSLKVNGRVIGNYIYGKDKLYEDPERWAAKQLPKRLAVIDRNIERLISELKGWQEEREDLTQ